MKRRLIGCKSQYLILLGLIFMVVVMVNVGDSSATNTTNLTDHNGMVKKASSSIYSTYPTNNRTKERFTTIDEAVNSKNTINGDTIIVGEGNYIENVKIDKRIILMAFNNANITGKDPDIPIFTVSNTGSGTVIKGFNFKITGTMCAVELKNSNSNQLVGNKITGSGPSGKGIQVLESNNNLIQSNVISKLFSGISLVSSLNNSLKYNTISKIGEGGIGLFNCFGTDDLRNIVGYNNITSCLYGVQLELSFHNSIFNNIISNSTSKNIYSLNSECNTFYQNNLSNAPVGILFKNSDDCTVVSNVITCNSPGSCGIILENNDSTISGVSRNFNVSGPIIVGSIEATSLPDIDVHYNRIICPVGIKNGNNKVTVNAGQNWWGSNHPAFNKLVSGSVKYPTWIYMTISTKTQRTIQGSKLVVTTSFNNLYNGKTMKTFSPKIVHIPNGTLNFFVTNIGKFEGNYLKADTTDGQAVTTYRATKLGKATLTSTTDNQTLIRIINVEPVLKVLKLNSTSLKRGKSSYGLITIYLNKQVKKFNGSWIELKQVSKSHKLMSFKTRVDKNHIYISPKTALKRGVSYKLIIHSKSVGDDTGNGLSNAYVKTLTM